MTIASLWQTYKYFMSFFLLYDFILFLKRTWVNVLCYSDVTKENTIMTIRNSIIELNTYLLAVGL